MFLPQVCRVSPWAQPKAQKDPQSDMWSSVSRCLSLLFLLRDSAPQPSRTFPFTPCAQEGGECQRSSSALRSGDASAESQGDHRTHPSQDLPRSFPFRPRSQVPRCLFSSVWKPLFHVFVHSQLFTVGTNNSLWDSSRVVHIHDANWIYGQKLVQSWI